MWVADPEVDDVELSDDDEPVSADTPGGLEEDGYRAGAGAMSERRSEPVQANTNWDLR